ncbi:unnamed protein product [Candida verbasci]|uniref:mRNA cap guanine-N(7) methyltransferase n=1 Tax=Candida verbasci TaxID=1227364 RepID=A0A9W4TWG4_9ASCO|nr:unnamed protein product [Candida verbasci]
MTDYKKQKTDNNNNNNNNEGVNQFSRRGEESNSYLPSSIYANKPEKLPAWLEEKLHQDRKYDKYGTRQQLRDQNDRADAYAKYGAKETQNSRLNRLKRTKEESRQETPQEEEHDDDDDADEEEISPYIHLDVANPSVNHFHKKQQQPNYHTFQSKIYNKENKDIDSIVKMHYNQRTQQSKHQGSRTNSPIYKLRNFNNTIKYILLSNWGKQIDQHDNFTLLDLCCGKGGDLNKCEFIKINQYIGVDIANLSVKEAFERYSRQKARFKQFNNQRNSNRYNFEAYFATGDCFDEFIPNLLEPNFPGIIDRLFPVDVVSVQFSLHYAFETEEKVRTLLTNISRSLKSGGRFIGTIPSSDFIKDKIVKNQLIPNDKGKLGFGNELYSVTFDKEPSPDGIFRPPFGNKYNYWLRDAVDDVPEYVVPFETLRALCEEYDLVLKYKKNFQEIFTQEIPKYFKLLNRNLIEGLKRSDGKYGVEGEEKEAVAFYVGFVFEKSI